MAVKENEDAILERLLQSSKKQRKSENTRDEKELKKAQKRRQELNNLFAKMYEDRVKGLLDEENYSMLSVKYRTEQQQLDILADLDNLLLSRSEFCLSKWIGDSHKLAQNDAEKKYFDFNARALITQWGDVKGENILYDYSWREWSGLIKEYYAPRWKLFYDEAISLLEKGCKIDILCTTDFDKRKDYIKTSFGKKLFELETQWIKTYKEYPYPVDSDVVPAAKALDGKWETGK